LSEKRDKTEILREIETQINDLKENLRGNIIKSEEQISLISQINKQIDDLKSDFHKLTENKDDQMQSLTGQIKEYDYYLGEKVKEIEQLNIKINELKDGLILKDKEITAVENEIMLLKEEFENDMKQIEEEKDNLLAKAKLVYQSSEREKKEAIQDLEAKIAQYEREKVNSNSEIKKEYEDQLKGVKKEWNKKIKDVKKLNDKRLREKDEFIKKKTKVYESIIKDRDDQISKLKDEIKKIQTELSKIKSQN